MTAAPSVPIRTSVESSVVEVSGVQKVFDTKRGRHEALKSIDLQIHDGEFLTILGPSGCGKTTLLRILAGFEQPTAGVVALDGEPINDVPANKRPMAMVFQSYALFPHLTVFENIAYGLRIAKTPRDEIEERVGVVMSIMDLAGLEQRLPTQLSGGQQQRVALARSVVIRPRVLLFDEPLSNLDARLREQMRSELRRIQQQLGITSVYVTHDQTEAMAMSDRIVVMSEGRIEQVGAPHEIYRRPATLFVADFIGKANVLRASALKRSSEGLSVSVLGTHLQLHDPGGLDEDFVLVLRPEDVTLTPLDSPNDRNITAKDRHIQAPGWVRRIEYLGAATQFTVELNDGTLLEAMRSHSLARDSVGDLPGEGDGVLAMVHADALLAVKPRP